jgi:hypothetical protein
MNKTRGIVVDVADPKNLGRLKAALVNFGETMDDSSHNTTPWCWPCVAMATDGAGAFNMPPVDSEVWIERTAEGDFVWTGCFWSERNAIPVDASAPDVRVIRTPAGHQVKIDEAGDIEILHANGNVVALRENGDIDITVSGNANVTASGNVVVTASGKVVVDGSQIELNGSGGDIVTTKHNCAYTGGPHVLGSTTVKAGG